MGRFEKHLGIGKEIEIEGEKFTLKPLGTEELPAFYRFMKLFRQVNPEGVTEASFKDILASMDEDVLNAFKTLIDRTLEKSFPEEWKSEREAVKAWGVKNSMLLLGEVLALNSADAGNQTTKQDRIDEFKKQMMEARKSGNSNPDDSRGEEKKPK